MNEGAAFELLGYFVTVWSPSPQAQRTEYPRRGSKSLKEKVDTDQCDCPVTWELSSLAPGTLPASIFEKPSFFQRNQRIKAPERLMPQKVLLFSYLRCSY